MNGRWAVSSRRAIVLAASILVFALAGCGKPFWFVQAELGEAKARKDDLPIMYYFKSWDSTAHRNMMLDVFADGRVKHEMMDTVNIELEFAWNEQRAKIYGVGSPQVCVMCTPGGRKVGSAMYVNPVPTAEKFHEWLKETKAAAMGTQIEPAAPN